jgi:hypothetical protein
VQPFGVVAGTHQQCGSGVESERGSSRERCRHRLSARLRGSGGRDRVRGPGRRAPLRGLGKAHRLDVQRCFGPPLILHHDLGHETLDERMTDAATHRSDEMFPTRLSLVTYNLWGTERWPEREAALRLFCDL